MIRRPPRSTRTDTLFPYTTLFRSAPDRLELLIDQRLRHLEPVRLVEPVEQYALHARPRESAVLAFDPPLHRLPQLGESLEAEVLRGLVADLDGLALLEFLDVDVEDDLLARSEERRVGHECVSTCRSRWGRDP